MVFYRKYRPQTIEDLDNKTVAETISKFLARDSFPHAFLFAGPKGTGKTSTARIVAKSINCLHAKKGQACGTCDMCVGIAKGENLDILEIDAASNRGIDEIRELREKIKLTPISAKYKVYIIDEVHMLTTEAFNALLKTLEEPPAHAVFILATTETHKVPETIVSRCVRVHFTKATPQEILHALGRIVTAEKIDIDQDALEAIAEASDGSFRDASKLLEEAVATVSGKLDLIHTQKIIGTTDHAFHTECLLLLQQKKAAKLFELMRKLELDGVNIRQFFISIVRVLQRELYSLVMGNESLWTKKELVTCLTLFHNACSERTRIIPSLPFELAIVEYCEGERKAVFISQSPTSAVESESSIIPPVDPGNIAPVVAKWSEILEFLKSYNHSIAGVLRSCKPVALNDTMMTIETQFKFHADRINDVKVHDLIAKAVKEIMGFDVKIKTVLKQR